MLGYGALRDAPTDGLRLQDQADHLAEWVARNVGGPVHIVGHSVGGAISVLFAKAFPELVVSLTSVEGNFVLKDAFWSGQIAKKSIPEVQRIIDGYVDDVSDWLAGSAVIPSDDDIRIGKDWLLNQPASTIIAQAKAVVEATGDASYLKAARAIIDEGTPFHLISGEQSRAGWNVPQWVVERAATDEVIADTGHLMMLQKPVAFAATILRNVCAGPTSGLT